MEEGEATVQERSVIIQRVNLLMMLKVPKLVRISVCGLFFIMETSDGRSCIFFNSPTLSLIRMCILL